MKKLKHFILKILLGFLGKIQIFPIPLWLMIGHCSYKMTGKKVRKVLEILKPGDILLRTYKYYVSAWLTPGTFTHAAIYVGNNKVIHAVGEGVIETDILEFLECDGVAILRPTQVAGKQAIKRAYKALGKEYDWAFSKGDKHFYCTELIAHCFEHAFKPPIKKSGFGKGRILPDAFLQVKKLKIIWDHRD